MDERYNAWNYQEYIEKLENEIARLREENKRLAEIPHEQDLLYMQAYINHQALKEENARLRNMAAVFCNENNWTLNYDSEISWYEWCGEGDPILIAREILNFPEVE